MRLRRLRSLRGRRELRRALPLPPAAMRQLVGPLDDASYDNPTGSLAYPFLPPSAYDAVFDFGCGCGRVARRLMLQRPRPRRYVGIDLHAGMIEWCRANLAPHAPEFTFLHHDVHNFHFNPGPDKPREAPFPVEDGAFSLVNADSVFTHLTQEQAAHYLGEVARVLRPDGVLNATWFFFDRSAFPMLRPENGAIYVSYVDPAAAVVFDRSWVTRTAADAGLTISSVLPPQIRGYQWTVLMSPARDGLEAVEIPPDTAPPGSIFLPELPGEPDRIGW
jgi:SAM-dependent methyltransferase